MKEREAKAYETLAPKFGWKNRMQAPKIEKIVVSVGTGSMREKGSKRTDFVADRLEKITGQKAAARMARTSISTFKLRQGELVGYQVTLRGRRMYDFLDKLVNISLPRTKDFRGIPGDSVDEMGNYTIGIKEHTIFPETADEDIKDVFGLAITIVTSVSDPVIAKAFLGELGLPFKKPALK
jgi:large subunit ribosomal protein L5